MPSQYERELSENVNTMRVFIERFEHDVLGLNIPLEHSTLRHIRRLVRLLNRVSKMGKRKPQSKADQPSFDDFIKDEAFCWDSKPHNSDSTP